LHKSDIPWERSTYGRRKDKVGGEYLSMDRFARAGVVSERGQTAISVNSLGGAVSACTLNPTDGGKKGK